MNVSNLPIIAMLLVFGLDACFSRLLSKKLSNESYVRGNPNTLYTEIGISS
jgi:hypothetical protein